MAITYVVNSVTVGTGSSNSITSGSLSLAVDDIIVASYANEDWGASSGSATIANSGSALSWTVIKASEVSGNCSVKAWWAKSPDTTARTVTCSVINSIASKLDCVVHTGAHTTNPCPSGNAFSGSGGTDISQSITPTASGSALWFAGGDWGATNSFTPIANCTQQSTHHVASGYTGTFIRPTTQPRTDANAFTIGETDTAGTIAWIAFEVQAAGDGSTPLTRNLPQFVAKGAFSGQATAAAPTMPTFNAGDLLVLVQVSANQAITVPGTYTEVSSSPQSTGTAAAAGGIRLSVATRVAVAGDAAPTLTDTGNMNAAQIYSFRGIDSASPINVQAGTTQAATTAVVFSNPTTTTDNCLILNVFGNDRDIGASGNLSSVANAGLANLTTQHDECVAAGVGGGLALITGQKLTAGAVGGTTATNAASVTNASITIALQGSPKIPDWTITQKSTPLRM